MAWTAQELHDVLSALRERGGDSTLIEVKSAAGVVPQLAETLCAFGNMPEGGTIIFGVDEKQGFAVTGVSDVAHLEAGVAAQARTSVTPPVHIDF
ncbi:MAG: ATP-binding protein, partial [Propionibacteriaceae bacterium]|nr:ATP-binding protein [Propionibacteriaceae bacterium]